MPTDEIPDDVLDLFAFAGEPARIVELASRLFDAGADRVEFGTPHGIDEARGVDLLAQQVRTGATRGLSARRPRRSAPPM